MKPFATTLDVGSSLNNLTGSWRTAKPVYVDRLPPCNATCPAGENIQAWLYEAEEGNYQKAWEIIVGDNPLPAVMGRACYHTCEGACNRGQLDQPVGIHAVERFLGDTAIEHGWKVPVDAADTGKKVLVVGAGPGGLSAAFHLRKKGHAVTIVEASAKAGGMLRYGIPRYRLPREVLDAEIARIEAMGVEIKYKTRIDDIAKYKADNGFDAVFLAIGAQNARNVPIANDGSLEVRDAIKVLRRVEEVPDETGLKGKVVVYGGGNVAMDVARSARRLGCEVQVLVREARHQMPAHAFEIHEAIEEGVTIDALLQVKEVKGGRIHVERMVLDDTNAPVPTGESFSIACDTMVLAIGQAVETDLATAIAGVETVGGAIRVDAAMATGAAGVFAGGDMVPSARSMTSAIGHGKKAAKAIDAFLRGEDFTPAAKPEIVDFKKLNTWYYADAPAAMQPMLDAVRRQSGFEEVLGNLDEDNALYEARRCLSCGNCFECDTCYGVCPDNAITKLGPGKRFEFKYDYCKGCGLCGAECPCGAIKMVMEEI